MKVCPNCGEVCEDHMNFCKSCGAKLGDVVGGGANSTYAEGPGYQGNANNENMGFQGNENNGNMGYQGNGYNENIGFQGNGYNGNIPPNGSGNFYGTPEGPNSGMAIASLVLGIVGLFLGTFLFIPCILAIVFGVLGMNQAKRGYRGRGMAIAGLVLGIIGVVVTIIVLVAAVAISKSILSTFPWESLGGMY